MRYRLVLSSNRCILPSREKNWDLEIWRNPIKFPKVVRAREAFLSSLNSSLLTLLQNGLTLLLGFGGTLLINIMGSDIRTRKKGK